MLLRRAAIWTLLDQCLLSAVHFALGLIVLRLCDKPAYGQYVLGWSLLLGLAGLQNAVFNTQMTVQAAGRTAEERTLIAREFITAAIWTVFPAAALISFACLVLAITTPEWRTALFLTGTVALSFIGVAMREFARSFLLLDLNAQAVLRVDVGYALCAMMSMAVVAMLADSSTIQLGALAALGLASAIASSPRLRLLIRGGMNRKAGLERLRSTLHSASWAAAGVTVTYAQSQSYVYLIGAFAGLAAAAEAGAARLLMTPIALINTSVQRVIYPHQVALVHQQKHSELKRISRLTLALLLVVAALYVLALLATPASLLAWVLGPDYAVSDTLLLLFGSIVALEAARSVPSTQLQALRRFKAITLANAATAVMVVAFAAAAIPAFGIAGGIASQACGELALGLALWGLLARARAQASRTNV